MKSIMNPPANPPVSGNWNIQPRDLGHVRLLAGVAPDDIADLLAASEEMTLEAGEALLMPGMCNTHLYLLLSGQLRVAPVSPDGDDGWLLEAGEAVGELAMVNRQPTSAYVLAEQPSRLLAVPHETFWALADVSHAVARNLLINLGRHLRQADTGVARSERLQKHYLQSAGVDDPTGLRNRRWFEHTLRRQALRSHFAVTPLSLVVVRIDGYADYCSHFGTEAGDAALYAVARALEQNARPTDILARGGPAEFMLALPDTGIDGARVLARRLESVVAETVVVLHDQSILPPVTARCGCAEHDSLQSIEQLIALAVEASRAAGGREG